MFDEKGLFFQAILLHKILHAVFFFLQNGKTHDSFFRNHIFRMKICFFFSRFSGFDLGGDKIAQFGTFGKSDNLPIVLLQDKGTKTTKQKTPVRGQAPSCMPGSRRWMYCSWLVAIPGHRSLSRTQLFSTQ